LYIFANQDNWLTLALRAHQLEHGGERPAFLLLGSQLQWRIVPVDRNAKQRCKQRHNRLAFFAYIAHKRLKIL
jgi:hypothetical protein